MNTWYDYRAVWAAHPWVILVVLLGLACVVVSVVATVTGGALAFLFIPGLAAIYVHHLIVQRKVS